MITDSSTCNTDSASAIAYCDWTNTLKREGVPFDTVVTSDTSPGSVPLPGLSTTLANGTQVANYEGVIVATSGAEGLSAAQWTALQTFEQKFSVRQITAYAVPSADYGLSAPSATNFLSNTSALTLTADGAKVFPYLNAVALDAGTFGYQGTPLAGAKVDTLISGPNGSTVLGVYTSADGRETMFQTFNQNQFLLQSGLLRHGELAWLARSTYFGDQRNYLETHIDDNFLSDDTWNTATHSTDYTPANALRETPADVTKAVNWSAQNKFRIDMLYNGGGSRYGGSARSAADLFPGREELVRLDQPHMGPPQPRPGMRARQLHRVRDQPEQRLGDECGDGPRSNVEHRSDSGARRQQPWCVRDGEHSGLANLVPGNPGTVDPPGLRRGTHGDATRQWRTRRGHLHLRDHRPVLADGRRVVGVDNASSARRSRGAQHRKLGDGDWDAVCHASDYKIYRQNPDATWSLVTTVTPSRRARSPAPAPQTDELHRHRWRDGAAIGSPQPRTPRPRARTSRTRTCATAFGALHITDFGSDASKPYPNPATTTFPTGSSTGTTFRPARTFTDGGATAVPRYPTNIFYNVSTNAQEVDEYQTIYDSPTCVPISGVTTCNPAGTAFTSTRSSRASSRTCSCT